MKKYIVFVFLAIMACLTMDAQTSIPKQAYFHLEGTINDNIQVSMELIKFNDSLYADYTYQFSSFTQNEYKIFYGSCKQLSGKMIANNNFLLKEPFSENGPVLKGKFINGSTMTGTWETGKGQKFPFLFAEKYREGTVQFNLFHEKSNKKLVAGPRSPQARIELVVLLPAVSGNPYTSDTLSHLMQQCFFGLNTVSASPEVLINGMKEVYFENYISSNESVYKEMPDGASFEWELIKYMHIIHNESNLLTFYILSYAFTGGAHGLETHDFFSIDLLTGKRIKLEDILLPGKENELNKMLTHKLHQIIGISDAEKLTDSGYFTDEVKANENYYLTGNGLGFFYNHYELAPYSFGFTDIFLTFNELKGLLK